MAKCTIVQAVIIALFIITGTVTTIVMKWADHEVVPGESDEGHRFNHPFVQTFFMFLGEFINLWIFYALYCYLKRKGEGEEDTHKFTKGTRKFNPLLMIPTCIFDLCGTSCSFIGLNLTYASSFQMFRGSVIIFTGIFSFLFLGKRLKPSELVGMLLVFLGLVIVGVCDFFLTTESIDISPMDVVIGDAIIILGQVFLAFMMVYQQKVYCTRMDVPALQAVGLEGLWGLIITTILLIIFYFCYVGTFSKNPREVLEDAIDACVQLGKRMDIFAAMIGYSLCTTLYNACGLTITKELSALTRKVLDSVRTVTVWIISIYAFNDTFHWQALLGFAVLMYGLFLYNGLSIYGSALKKREIE